MCFQKMLRIKCCFPARLQATKNDRFHNFRSEKFVPHFAGNPLLLVFKPFTTWLTSTAYPLAQPLTKQPAVLACMPVTLWTFATFQG
jgi:hypothetical protein